MGKQIIMKDTIYLVAKKGSGITSMFKTSRGVKNLKKGEIPIKLTVTIDDGNWKPPFIEKSIHVDRWDQGIEMEDVEFEGHYVTEEEFELIRQRRLDNYIEILNHQGYDVIKREEE